MIDEKLIRSAEATLRKIVPYQYNVPAEEVEDAYRAVIEAIKQGGQILQWRNTKDELPPIWTSILGKFKTQGGIEYIVTERIMIDGKSRYSAACGLEPFAWALLPGASEHAKV